MRNSNSFTLFIISVLMGLIVFFSCNQSQDVIDEKEQNTSTYLNLADSARYVGMETCAQCHGNKHETFLHTGMGQSFGLATKSKSAAKISNHQSIYDKDLDLFYKPFWDADTFKILEYRLEGKDTIHQLSQRIDYVVGSGQHTNSHLFLSGGYLFQAPLTWYAQKQQWDLPPGFEMGANTRFSRKIGLECMSCHNALPQFEVGSENKFSSIPGGISCERCHGPGSIHVQQKKAGILVDTANAIDYSIVNPGKLSIDLQFDICQRCHLQGNAVLKDDHSFFDFKPGMKLSDVMTIFLPRYKNDEENFIMASHADRLKMSQCFIASNKDKENVRGNNSTLTCITCHNPHVSVKQTGQAVFNQACLNCHKPIANKEICSEVPAKRMAFKNNCVACHMPSSGSVDIPHVSIHDHFIRKPVTNEKLQKVKEFVGLMAVNEKNPSRKIRLEAYLNQFEKFDRQPYLLDSAKVYLDFLETQNSKNYIDLKIRYYHLKSDFVALIQIVEKIGVKLLLQQQLTHKSKDNKDAWTCYRIGEGYYNVNNPNIAFLFFERATNLAPFQPEFLNKKAASLMQLNRTSEAELIYKNLIKEHPYFAPGFSNLAYLLMQKGMTDEAMKMLNKSLQLDPDYELAVFNKASLLMQLNKKAEALKLLSRFLKRFPQNEKTRKAILSITNS
jgi:tetratricopeptide (TPR) repeat protein